MNEKIACRTKLRLIQGGLHSEISFGPVRIIAAPENIPPFELNARAYEEDTWLVMSADPKGCEPEVHPIRLMTELMETKPEPVGSVIVKGGNPLRFLAIVHDVNRDPTWKEEWIQSALEGVFREVEQRKIRAIGLPLLGTLHGRLETRRFLALLGRVLKQKTFNHLKRLWLIVPAKTNSEIIEMLEAELNQS